MSYSINYKALRLYYKTKAILYSEAALQCCRLSVDYGLKHTK